MKNYHPSAHVRIKIGQTINTSAIHLLWLFKKVARTILKQQKKRRKTFIFIHINVYHSCISSSSSSDTFRWKCYVNASNFDCDDDVWVPRKQTIAEFRRQWLFFSLSLYLFCAHCLNFSLFFFCVFGVIQCLLIEVNWYSFCYFDHCSATFICHFMSIHDCLISYFQWFWNDVCFDFGVYQYYYSNAFPGIRYKIDTRTQNRKCVTDAVCSFGRFITYPFVFSDSLFALAVFGLDIIPLGHFCIT